MNHIHSAQNANDINFYDTVKMLLLNSIEQQKRQRKY